MTKKVGGEKVTLSISDYVKLGSMFLVVISLLISVKVDVATDKERINQLEIQNIFQKSYNNDQILINKCIQNAFAKEFGKNLYYYNDQFVYRGGNNTTDNNSR
jgi:hypothetical protein